jgi:hypothetical protein
VTTSEWVPPPPFLELRILKDLAEGCLEVRILKEVQCQFFEKNVEVLDLRKIKELACALDVQIPKFRVAWLGFLVKYFITSLSNGMNRKGLAGG